MPGVLGTGAEAPDYFLRKNNLFLWGLAEALDFFLKKLCGRDCWVKFPVCFIISSEKNDHFFWRNNKHTLFRQASSMPHYFFRKKWSFFSEEIMRNLLVEKMLWRIVVSAERLELCWRNSTALLAACWRAGGCLARDGWSWCVGAVLLPSKIRIFFAEIMRRAQTSKDSTTPGVLGTGAEVPHYFFRKKWLFFSEEIMKHAGVSPCNNCFIISSEKNAYFFLKK